ncbi:MAG TPA: LysE family translocator [Chloroflexia bacterium]|nr:LysE family translocator [Chloroflexia bacterium]
MDTRTLAFVGVAALLTITPGADMAIVTKVALGQGRRAALLTTLGILSGLLVWGFASALGLAALFTASATAFTILKLVGAAYLIYLGIQAFRQNQHHGSDSVTNSNQTGERRHTTAFRQGLLGNLLNPKIGVFYTTFLPQFIAPGDPVLFKSVLLTLIHAFLSLLWLVVYASFVTRSGDLLRRPKVKQGLDRVTGVVLITLGLRLALEKQ